MDGRPLQHTGSFTTVVLVLASVLGCAFLALQAPQAQADLIAYTKDDGRSKDIYTLDPDSIGLPAEANITHSPLDELVPTLSPSGDRLAYAKEIPNVDIFSVWVSAPDGSNPRLVGLTPLGLDPRSIEWSPDASKLAITSSNFAESKIVIAPVTAGQRLTVDGIDPAWSPDGSELAYSAIDFARPGSTKLVVRNIASGVERQIAPDLNADRVIHSNVYWSARGKIAYTEFAMNDGNPIVPLTWLTNPQGARRQLISVTMQANGWSRSGDRLALSNKGGTRLAVADHTSGQVAQLVDLGDDRTVGRPAWSPDGRYLITAYARRDDDGELVRIDTQTGALRPFTDNEFNDYSPSWAATIEDGAGGDQAPPPQPDPVNPDPAPSAPAAPAPSRPKATSLEINPSGGFRKKRFTVRVHCQGEPGSSCVGRLTLKAKRGGKQLKIGRVDFRLKAGARRTLKVKPLNGLSVRQRSQARVLVRRSVARVKVGRRVRVTASTKIETSGQTTRRTTRRQVVLQNAR